MAPALTPRFLWARYLAWPFTNAFLLAGSMSVVGFVVAIGALAIGVPTGDYSPAEVVVGGLLTPIALLAGPGLVVGIGLIALIGWGSSRGLGRRFAVLAALLAGVVWLLVFFAPQLLSADGVLPGPEALVVLVPWTAYGLVARLQPAPPRDIR